MFARVTLLVAALALALAGAGATALARGGGHGHHGKQGNHGKHFDGGESAHHTNYSEWDEEWLKMSIEGDRFEIAGGKIALDKATNQKVRDLAQTLIDDHTKSLQESIDLANQLGIRVPDEPSPSQQWELQAVSKFSGNDFDQQYSLLEVKDHQQDIDEAQEEAEEGTNEDVRAEAQQEIPTLQHHLQLAQEALQASGGQS